ncbi:MAG: hypothetical protein AMXMBFR46_08100 [Acidimicrobiia bacterium]
MAQPDPPMPSIHFRPMVADDLPLVEEWLLRPHVQPWWVAIHDLPEIRRAVHGEVAVDPWIIVIDQRDAGYIQVYDVGYDADYGAACASVGAGPGTAGIDYLIGEADLVGGGVGTRVIAAFVEEIVFGRAPWPAVCAGPDPRNAASIRVLEKNGFRYAGTIDTTDGPEHLMVRTRDEPEG